MTTFVRILVELISFHQKNICKLIDTLFSWRYCPFNLIFDNFSLSDNTVRCVEPSNVKQKRHPNPNSVNENSFEDRKSGPPQAAEVNHPHPKKKSSPEDNSRSVDSAERSEVGQLHEEEEEVMYSDGGQRAAVVSGLHPKLQQAPTISSASIFSLYFSLQTGLLVLASLWCT